MRFNKEKYRYKVCTATALILLPLSFVIVFAGVFYSWVILTAAVPLAVWAGIVSYLYEPIDQEQTQSNLTQEKQGEKQ